MVFWCVLAVFLVLLTLRIAEPVWDVVKPLQLVQYSWRFFLILSFIMSFVIGGLVFSLPEGWRSRGALVLACVIILWYAPFCKPGWGDGTKRMTIPDIKTWLYTQRPMDNMEYMPKEVKKIPMVGPANRFEVLKGYGAIEPGGPVPLPRQAVTVRSASGALVCFHHFYFPGWTVAVDDRATKIFTDNDPGVMLFLVPPGEHRIVARFGHTPVRTVGETISLVTLLTILGVSVALWVRKKRIGIKG